METLLQTNSQLQYAEVYISDMISLKNIFLQTQTLKKLNQNFGVPFLLVKKKSEVVAFATLVISEKEEIVFKIYETGLSASEKSNFTLRAERYFKKSTMANFRDPEQLKSSISRMVSWLNVD
ncbi:hypothetical protein [Chryseobacterium vrystaatense]|uniref:Uncharacterized protein n=1 Tax=Chryseobacterium vrystaatense TaxID=307480 RepID=A0A1M4U2N2_9FLAO|nr:hypothetical protein [Chryseobacterium vrystaatense]KFF28363.1 hypothetical protein IW16_03935 [Chryseobacterium vrystaatense]SHE50953.1 hypothetical protein SAMN02787073_0518 [Chryseobacterium vrystaatense]